VDIEFMRCKEIKLCTDGTFASNSEHCADPQPESTNDATVDELIDSGGGDSLWAEALALVAWLEAHPEEVRGKTVLELGCGLGLVSLAAVKLGASLVVATDGSLLTTELAQHNMKRNLPEALARAQATQLLWGDAENAERVTSLSPDARGIQPCDCISETTASATYQQLITALAAQVSM
jgi:predicted nicotinamide N-methyase